ncbi:YraN family protein [Lichenibacterium dinghuense]|uniref:YraN family protein n=1 Tax=Lichenibacterium dinghuense TaxID=2895977 RepID=UPI001EFFCCB4|nr:YraN family protein [Lichenibacterium sp. 6Y81]
MRRRGAEERRRAGRAGRRAEWLAAAWLTCKGYRILARGFTVSGGEIDIVATRGGTLAFVEVKARADRGAALDAIDAVKRRRIARAAAVWLSRNAWAAGSTFRGDAVLVAPRRWPSHVADAFPVPIG